MANKIKLRRGKVASMPTLEVAEPGFTTDNKNLVIGSDSGNVTFPNIEQVHTKDEFETFKTTNNNKINAIENGKQDKLVAGENITIDENNVISASGGGGEVDLDEMAYFDYAGNIYGDKYSLLANAWQDMKNSETVLFDIPLALVAPNQEMGGMTIDLYVGTNGQLQALYDACVSGAIRPPYNDYVHEITTFDSYYVNNAVVPYMGDMSGDVDFPIPLYAFGGFGMEDEDDSFAIADLTPLGMGLGLTLAKIVNVSIPNNNIVIQQGFEFESGSGIIIPNSVTSIGMYAFVFWLENNQPLVIPNSVTSIRDAAFYGWTSNNQPLVIPNSVTSIRDAAFVYWTSNNQPLVIPNSVTSIGNDAFDNWTSNNHPLVIPNSVTSIGQYAFGNWTSNNQPLVIPNSVTSIGNDAFRDWTSNNQPLVIPNSVTSIGSNAFNNWQLVPYIEIQAITPPTLASSLAFDAQNDAPIYVPDESVDDYKKATQWVELADRIFPISDKGNAYTKGEIDLMIGDIESALDAILGV